MLDLVKTIKNFDLRPSVRRDLSFLLISCVAHSYADSLEKNFGLSYKALMAMGKKDFFWSFVNQNFFSRKLEKILKSKKRLDELRKKAFVIFNGFKKSFRQAARSDPYDFFYFLSNQYPVYFSALGFYNSLWRVIGDRKLSGRLLKELSDERTKVAKFYVLVEEEIKKQAELFGRSGKFNGELLRHLSLLELREFIKKSRFTSGQKKKIQKRFKGYVYLYYNHQETISTDKKIIKEIEEKYLGTKAEIKRIKGYGAYLGKAIGYVNLGDRPFGKKDILVTSMTKPENNLILRKYKAIVTDEGGVLSHASIISRELKIPCVIGTKIATRVFKNGDLVEVDANKGIVRKI